MTIFSQYDLLDIGDIAKLNKLLNPIGISIETGLFDNPYILIDKTYLELNAFEKKRKHTFCKENHLKHVNMK